MFMLYTMMVAAHQLQYTMKMGPRLWNYLLATMTIPRRRLRVTTAMQGVMFLVGVILEAAVSSEVHMEQAAVMPPGQVPHI